MNGSSDRRGLASQNKNEPTESFVRNGMLLVLCIALAKFILHIAFNNRYGYFRDEFDYILAATIRHGAMWISPRCMPVLSRSESGDFWRLVA